MLQKRLGEDWCGRASEMLCVAQKSVAQKSLENVSELDNLVKRVQKSLRMLESELVLFRVENPSIAHKIKYL